MCGLLCLSWLRGRINTIIDVLVHTHEPDFGAYKITEGIIKKQSLDVDVVTGATKSSIVMSKNEKTTHAAGIDILTG